MSSDKKIIIKAPSNIALIKYMGKDDPKLNLPSHGSLSMTLNSLCTVMQLEPRLGSAPLLFTYDPLKNPSKDQKVPDLDQKNVERMHRHFEKVTRLGGSPDQPLSEIKWRTWNTFPAGTGIASSASSFAAGTLGILAATAQSPLEFKRKYDSDSEFRSSISALCRQGSGSSCRSLDGPYVFWERETATPIPSAMPELTDLVCLVSSKTKSVSSSEAHLRVKASPLWEGRVARVETRLSTMKSALNQGDLPRVAMLAWQEAWEMHSLFHTSAPPFTYFEPATLQILKYLETTQTGDEPPIVTLDAGPNVHVLVPTHKSKFWKSELKNKFNDLEILEDTQGTGAKIEFQGEWTA